GRAPHAHLAHVRPPFDAEQAAAGNDGERLTRGRSEGRIAARLEAAVLRLCGRRKEGEEQESAKRLLANDHWLTPGEVHLLRPRGRRDGWNRRLAGRPRHGQRPGSTEVHYGAGGREVSGSGASREQESCDGFG